MENLDELDKVHIRLPWPPSVNSYWARTKKGMRVSDKGEEYKFKIWQLINEFNLTFRLEIKLQVIVHYSPPDKRVRDIDNYSKGLYDALTEAGLWLDDNLIKQQIVTMGEPIKGGRVDMLIKPFDTSIDYYEKLRNGWID